MSAKKRSGSIVWVDPDGEPELTADMRAEAEVAGQVDPRLREGGPGWQSRIDTILRKALGMEGAMVGRSQRRAGGATTRAYRSGR